MLGLYDYNFKYGGQRQQLGILHTRVLVSEDISDLLRVVV